MTTMGSNFLFVAALLLMALAAITLAAGIWLRQSRQNRNRQVVDRALAAREARRAEATTTVPDGDGRMAAAMRAAERLGARLERGRWSDALLASEDRELIDMCGFADTPRARAWFIVARVAAIVLLCTVVMVERHALLSVLPPGLRSLTALFFGFALGYMLPKWVISRRARRRRQAADEELPLLIDLLRLLQGVGLSVDQSLQVIVTEFAHVLPVLTSELRIAVDLHSRGRTREQSLQRLATSFENDDLQAICRLIVQVERHGGAVQEPLQRFAERVRDKRRMGLKEKIGRLTVKMTGVMVVTLLPALMIVTGGAGLIAVLRGMSRVSGGF